MSPTSVNVFSSGKFFFWSLASTLQLWFHRKCLNIHEKEVTALNCFIVLVAKQSKTKISKQEAGPQKPLPFTVWQNLMFSPLSAKPISMVNKSNGINHIYGFSFSYVKPLYNPISISSSLLQKEISSEYSWRFA